jgi:signal transduction histidine kinase/CheY-like chemotaxis protein
VVGVSEIARDITAQRQAELALRDAEERMRVALEAADVGVWDANLQTDKVYWSDICAKMHGVTPATFGGTFEAFVERVHPEDRDHVFQQVQQASGNCGDADFVYRTRWADETDHYIAARARFYGDGGRARRATGITIDITDRRSLEEQLRQAQKMEAVGQLAGGVAHDFNNMLTAILGYAELLEGAFEPGDRALRDLEQIRKSGERAAALTRQLLAFSRRQILQPTIVDVNATVADLGSLMQRLIGEDIRLDLRLDPAIERIKADPGQLEQVIMNIAVNARDAMPDGGTLTIRTDTVTVNEEFFRRHGVVVEHDIRRFTRLSMSDTGIGMDEQTKRRIFEPFFTTKPKGRGTGLGLATVYGIVKQSGGFVFVNSAPLKGATFDVYLPCTEDIGRGLTDAVPDSVSAGGHECILLVEDEDAVRSLSRSFLERHGYSVIEASDADSALQRGRIDNHRLDLLLTDVVMPGRSGPELYAALRQQMPYLKVLFMSGYTDDAIVRKGILEPGTPFLQKPFNSSTLLRKIRDVLDSRVM